MPKQPVITINPIDNKVIVNGEAHIVDCSELKGIQAIQYCFPYGEIEYVPGELRPDRTHKSNSIIADISVFQKELDAWKVAKQEHDVQKAKFEADAAATFKAAEEATKKDIAKGFAMMKAALGDKK